MINIPLDERTVTDKEFFSSFNLDYKGLEKVKSAVNNNDIELAKKELVKYMHTRQNVKFIFDYRGMPLKKIADDEIPYSFQASLGLSGDLKEFCIFAGKKLMDNIYVYPSGKRGMLDLGKNFENMPHFNYPLDEGKKHRSTANLFTRGQFFEYLVFLYHETGDKKVLDKFSEVLLNFFEQYPLIVVDTRPDANRFMYTEDRCVMSVGWLAVVYLGLLYTELAYQLDYELTYQIIKRMWFLAIQFRHLDNDKYLGHNHHMWERGLVPFIMGTMFPEIELLSAMQKHGAEITLRHIKEDFNTSGGYGEHSIAYTYGAAVGEMIYRGVYIAQKNNYPLLDAEGREKLSKAFDMLAMITPPTEFFSSIGDAQGPMVNPLLKLGSVMLKNQYCTDLYNYRIGKKQSVDIPLYYSDNLSGYTCGKTGYGKKDTYFIMSTKVDCGYSGHNHMDMLSINYNVRGKDIVCEPYVGHIYHSVKMNSPQRGYLYNMGSHNSVLCYGSPICDDKMYANRWGVYRPDSPVKKLITNEKGMYVKAEHKGYTYCNHIRNVVFTSKGDMFVRDDIERGNRLNTAHIQRWHLSPDAKLIKIDDNSLLITNEDVKVLLVTQKADLIKIWKDTEILCPEMYQTEDELGYNIDIEFAPYARQNSDDTTFSLNTAFIDISETDEDIEILTQKYYTYLSQFDNEKSLAEIIE